MMRLGFVAAAAVVVDVVVVAGVSFERWGTVGR